MVVLELGLVSGLIVGCMVLGLGLVAMLVLMELIAVDVELERLNRPHGEAN